MKFGKHGFKLNLLLLFGIVSLFGSVMAGVEPCPPPLQGEFPACYPEDGSTYTGVYGGTDLPDLRNYEGAVGKRVMLIGGLAALSASGLAGVLENITYGLRDPERDTDASLLDAEGRMMSPYIPSIQLIPADAYGIYWNPKSMIDPGMPDYESIQNDIRGAARYLRQYYERTHRPVFVQPWWEIERLWSVVHMQHPDATLDDLKAAWCHLYNVFKEEEAHAIFVWHAFVENDELRGDPPYDFFEQVWMDFYPGDECVDWFGMSAFGVGIDQFELFFRDARRHQKKVLLVEFINAHVNCFSTPPNASGPPAGEDDDGWDAIWHRAWFEKMRALPDVIGGFQMGATDYCGNDTRGDAWGDKRLNGTEIGAWLRDEFAGAHGPHNYIGSAELDPPPPDFTLTVDQPNPTVTQGSEQPLIVTLTSDEGSVFDEPMTLSLASPPGITATFAQDEVLPTEEGTNITVSISVGPNVPLGPQKIWIRAEKNYVTRIVRITLNVQPAGPEDPPLAPPTDPLVDGPRKF